MAGTSLFQIIFTSAFSTVMHAVANQSVDILLALFLIVGGVIGARFGVLASKKINGARARVILALIVLAVCIRLGMQLFLEPANVFVAIM